MIKKIRRLSRQTSAGPTRPPFRRFHCLCRPLMTKLVSVDLLGKGTLDTETDIQHPAGRPFMLAFVNIAADRSTLTSDGSVLKAALTFLCNNLHSRGTVVVALPDWEFNRTTLKGDIETSLFQWRLDRPDVHGMVW